MILFNLRIEPVADKVRMCVDVAFEHQTSPGKTVYFQVNRADEGYLRLTYDAFLFSVFPVALVNNEPRIYVKGAVCPDALCNIQSMLLLFQKWYRHRIIPKIEYDDLVVQTAPEGASAGLFMSAGVDSVANFCRNIHQYPKYHPHRYKHAIFVYGMDLGDPNKPDAKDTYQLTTKALEGFLQAHDCKLVSIETNIRELCPNWRFYAAYHFGPLMAGIAHALSNRLSEFCIALDNQIQNYVPHGSHPWLNKYFCSSYLNSVGLFEAFTRLEKYRFIKNYPEAVPILRVCHKPPKGSQHVNCGRCEKCIRTKLELLVNDMLQSASFASQELTPELVDTISFSSILEFEYYDALIVALKNGGYSALSDVIARKRRASWPVVLKYKLMKFDQCYFQHRILKAKLKLTAFFPRGTAAR